MYLLVVEPLVDEVFRLVSFLYVISFCLFLLSFRFTLLYSYSMLIVTASLILLWRYFIYSVKYLNYFKTTRCMSARATFSRQNCNVSKSLTFWQRIKYHRIGSEYDYMYSTFQLIPQYLSSFNEVSGYAQCLIKTPCSA